MLDSNEETVEASIKYMGLNAARKSSQIGSRVDIYVDVTTDLLKTVNDRQYAEGGWNKRSTVVLMCLFGKCFEQRASGALPSTLTSQKHARCAVAWQRRTMAVELQTYHAMVRHM